MNSRSCRKGRALQNKWVHKLNMGDTGKKPRYKAQVMMNGFKQKKEVDFDEIFASIVKMTSIQTMLSIVASMDLEIE